MKNIALHELEAHISEIVRDLKETGEPVQVIDHGEAIALLVPVSNDFGLGQERWTDIEPFVKEISRYLPERVDAVEAVREIRG